MFTKWVFKLLQAYEALAAANTAFGDALRADGHLPLLLPEYERESDRYIAIKAMTQLWRLEPGEILAHAGVVCASLTTIQAAESLNQAKAEFRAAVKSVRDKSTEKKTRLDKLIDRVLLQQSEKERRRTEELQLALKRAQINRLDLLRCYANIRVLPKDLVSISWTWARTHSIIDSISRDEATKQAEKLSDEETREIALTRLSSLPSGQRMAYKKKLPNQLRANLSYYEDSEIKRKAVTISGIALSQDSVLPKMWVWRDDPGELDPKASRDRISRSDATIEPEPCIKALHLHLYNNDVRGGK